MKKKYTLLVIATEFKRAYSSVLYYSSSSSFVLSTQSPTYFSSAKKNKSTNNLFDNKYQNDYDQSKLN